jgi:hypothetical protein
MRLEACIALSLAVHTGFLILPFHTPADVVFPAPYVLTVALPSNTVDSIQKELNQQIRPDEPKHQTITPDPNLVELTPQQVERKRSKGSPPVYFPAAELTRKPMPLADWNEFGWRLPPQTQGTVSLTVFISATGVVDRIEFPQSISSEIQEWVRDTLFVGARFQPGERNGLPVPTRITYQFELAPIQR